MCRRCTLGAGSFSLSLAPSNHIIHSLLLKIVLYDYQFSNFVVGANTIVDGKYNHCEDD